VVVSSSLMHTEVDLTFEAMQAGALTVVRTPGLHDPATCQQVVRAVRLMADVPVVRRWQRPAEAHPASSLPIAPPVTVLPEAGIGRGVQIVGIASSTGGPGTLSSILQPLPTGYPLPIVIVQHITSGFAAGLAEWLDSQVSIRVALARHGDTPQPGTALIAPDDYHLRLNAQGLIELSRDKPVRSLRPSANYLFDALARYFGPRAAGVILTGMGDDGVDGLEAMYRAGAPTVAQDEPSCVVYGMPREAARRGVAQWVLTPEQISAWLMQIAQPGFRPQPVRGGKATQP
jgi:two-component system chemotaxis response regulator CheB